MAPFSQTLPRNGDGLRALPATVDALLDGTGANARAVFRTHLVAEEIFTNLVKYGGTPRPPDEVTLSLWPQEDGGVTLMIEDRTAPFSPIWAPQAPLQTDLATAQPGGLGLQLVRQTADELSYDSLPDGNRLVARFTP